MAMAEMGMREILSHVTTTDLTKIVRSITGDAIPYNNLRSSDLIDKIIRYSGGNFENILKKKAIPRPVLVQYIDRYPEILAPINLTKKEDVITAIISHWASLDLGSILAEQVEVQLYKDKDTSTKYTPGSSTENLTADDVDSCINAATSHIKRYVQMQQNSRKKAKLTVLSDSERLAQTFRLFQSSVNQISIKQDECYHFGNLVAHKLRPYDASKRSAIEIDIINCFTSASSEISHTSQNTHFDKTEIPSPSSTSTSKLSPNDNNSNNPSTCHLSQNLPCTSTNSQNASPLLLRNSSAPCEISHKSQNTDSDKSASTSPSSTPILVLSSEENDSSNSSTSINSSQNSPCSSTHSQNSSILLRRSSTSSEMSHTSQHSF